ncbi:hypothetical protein HYX16_02865 [Candidatus Woesearchaeota archaeon]|nr:hypothetical protein [Candidatus Woesearchaeota archaeon]
MPAWGNSKYYYWYYEPDKVRIKLEKKFVNKLVNKAIEKAGTNVNLSKLLNLSTTTIFNYRKGISMRVGGIKKILDYLDIGYSKINHKIKKVSFDFKPNIKVYSKEISILLAASLGDGHLSDSQFMYKNKDRGLLIKIEKYARKVFGNIKILHRIDKNDTPFILLPIYVRRVLENLGSPRGKKSFQNPRVPQIIRYGSLMMKKVFIQHFFDDEGWVEKENNKIAISQTVDCTFCLPKKYINKLTFKKNYTPGKISLHLREKIIAPNLLIDIKNILEKEFNLRFILQLKRIAKFKHKLKGVYISASWDLQCYSLSDIKRFQKCINFYSKNKRNKLFELINLNRTSPKNIYCLILNEAIKNVKEKGYFQTKDIVKSVNLQMHLVRDKLNIFVKKGIFNNEKGKYTHNLDLQ